MVVVKCKTKLGDSKLAIISNDFEDQLIPVGSENSSGLYCYLLEGIGEIGEKEKKICEIYSLEF